MAGNGRKRVKFPNVSLYFAIDLGQRGGHHYGKGREAGLKGTGNGSKRYGRREVQTPLSPPTIYAYRSAAPNNSLSKDFRYQVFIVYSGIMFIYLMSPY